jgi:hypothetical protein
MNKTQAVLTTIYVFSPEKFKPLDILKEIKTTKLGSEWLKHLPRRPLFHLPHLFCHCFRLCHFPAYWAQIHQGCRIFSNMSMAAVFCDIERAFDTSLIKLIAMTREIMTEVTQGYIFAPTLHSLYK